MPVDNPTSIAEGSGASSARALGWMVAATALVAGGAAALYYADAGLTLSHYDARGHLVVARRMIDGLTPGWRQIGAVWLPLPHLLDLPAVASDWGYRTGYVAAALSVGAMALGLAAISRFLFRATSSPVAAAVAPVLVLTNPNVLYLTSTPMTEPLLFGLSFVAVSAIARWVDTGTARDGRRAGAVLMCLVLTRYEGWLVASALVALAWLTTWRDRGWRAFAFAGYIGVAIVSFLVLGWATTGSWFVTGGFFEPDETARGKFGASAQLVLDGLEALGGYTLLAAAMAGAAMAAISIATQKRQLALTLALAAAALLPMYAFYEGHPHRIRYMVPLIAASGVLAAVAIGSVPRRLQAIAALVVVAGATYERPPLDQQAPMVLEAQWETPYRRAREAVTAYLEASHDGSPILASMGSLGHYMQESSHAGFYLRDFLHEGNGDLWSAALDAPGRHVNWVLIEERAEGGDILYARKIKDPSYLAGFDRVVEGGGMVLYRKTGP
jgi:hypothetical protein